MKVVLAKPRGFCAGVVRAIEIVERALEKYGAPVYVRHEIVHNKWVVDALKARGAIFVEDLSEVPANAITIFSAHGVAKKVEAEAKHRELRVLNATCPLVSKVHAQGRHYMRVGRTVVLIGHAGHPEVEGTLGQIPGPVRLVETKRTWISWICRPTPQSPMSPKPPSRSTTPRASSRRFIAAFPTLWGLEPRISAMRRKIAKQRC